MRKLEGVSRMRLGIKHNHILEFKNTSWYSASVSWQWSVCTLNFVGSYLTLRNSSDKTKLQYFTQNRVLLMCMLFLSLMLMQGLSGFFCFYNLSRYFPVKELHIKIYKLNKNRLIFFSKLHFTKNFCSLIIPVKKLWKWVSRTQTPLTFNGFGPRYEPQEQQLPLARADLLQLLSVSCAHPDRELEVMIRLFCSSRFGLHYSYEWPTPEYSLFFPL